MVILIHSKFIQFIDIIRLQFIQNEQRNTRSRARGNNAVNQRMAWVLSVTTGDMLQRLTAFRQLWNVLMSDPGYGDLCVILKNINSVLFSM